MRNKSKKIMAVLLVFIMSFSMVTPVLAAPSSNRATVADLEVIVRGYVERHIDQFLGSGSMMDDVVANFEAFVTELAVTTIRNILLDTEGLVDFTSPLISAAINNAINSALEQLSPAIPDVDVSFAVERVMLLILETGILETILSIQLVDDILHRAVEYAVSDAVDYAMGQIVFIPGEADVIELSRRYANEINGFNVVPFPLTNAFLGTSLANQALLMGHSLDLVNPFWAIEIHSHGFLNTQRTYRVTGWQRTVNTNSLEFLVNLIPGVSLNVTDFLSIENYVLARLGMDVVGGTYDGITNFDVDAFMAALPAIIWSATQRAVVDVITERIEAYIEYVLNLIEAEIRRGKDWLQSEIDGVINIARDAMRDAVNVILPIHACAREAFTHIVAMMEAGVALYFNTEAQVRDAIERLESIHANIRGRYFGTFSENLAALSSNLLGRLEVHAQEIVNGILNSGCATAWANAVSDLNNIFNTNFTDDMSPEEVLAELALVFGRLVK